MDAIEIAEALATMCDGLARMGEGEQSGEEWTANAAALRELIADAKRYRWLRDRTGRTNRQPQPSEAREPCDDYERGFSNAFCLNCGFGPLAHSTTHRNKGS